MTAFLTYRKLLRFYVVTLVVAWTILLMLPACSQRAGLTSTSIKSHWKVQATFTKQYDIQGSEKKLVLAREFHLIPLNSGISEVHWQASSFWYGNYGGSHKPVGSETVIDTGERIFVEGVTYNPTLPKIRLEEELDSLTMVIKWKDGAGTHSETHSFKGLKKQSAVRLLSTATQNSPLGDFITAVNNYLNDI